MSAMSINSIEFILNEQYGVRLHSMYVYIFIMYVCVLVYVVFGKNFSGRYTVNTVICTRYELVSIKTIGNHISLCIRRHFTKEREGGVICKNNELINLTWTCS